MLFLCFFLKIRNAFKVAMRNMGRIYFWATARHALWSAQEARAETMSTTCNNTSLPQATKFGYDQHRHHVVDMIAVLHDNLVPAEARKQPYGHYVIHLAMAYMDRYMSAIADRKDANVLDYKALACFVIASKYHGLPRPYNYDSGNVMNAAIKCVQTHWCTPEVLNAVPERFTVKGLHAAEIDALNHLGWVLNDGTILEVVFNFGRYDHEGIFHDSIFLSNESALQFFDTEQRVFDNPNDPEDSVILDKAREWLLFFCDISQGTGIVFDYGNVVTGLACVALTRFMCVCEDWDKIWPNEFQEKTKHAWSQIERVCAFLLVKFVHDFEQRAPEHMRRQSRHLLQQCEKCARAG